MRQSDALATGAELTDRYADMLEAFSEMFTDTEELGIPRDVAERWLRATVRTVRQRAEELTGKASRAKNRRRYDAAKK